MSEDAGMSEEDDKIRAVVVRLARPNAAGGFVVSRASLLAEGTDFGALREWILAHGGRSDAPAPAGASGGLHGGGNSAVARAPEYILPANAFS